MTSTLWGSFFQPPTLCHNLVGPPLNARGPKPRSTGVSMVETCSSEEFWGMSGKITSNIIDFERGEKKYLTPVWNSIHKLHINSIFLDIDLELRLDTSMTRGDLKCPETVAAQPPWRDDVNLEHPNKPSHKWITHNMLVPSFSLLKTPLGRVQIGLCNGWNEPLCIDADEHSQQWL